MGKHYEALVGLDYKNRRLEPGDIADDIPQQSVKWLLADGLIRVAKPAKAKTTAKDKD